MNREEKQRFDWVKMYEQTGNAGLTCRRCGISRPTLRKWRDRYQTNGEEGLKSQSRRPNNSPQKKVNKEKETLILLLRKDRRLGPRRMQSELKRLYDISLAVATIYKILVRNNVKPLIKTRKKDRYIRYSRPVPGDRVQMDTCKISPRLYQYTAIDDCTRYRVLRLYQKRTAENTVDFIEHMQEEMPFPIQRVQTDRGMEFFAIKVQKKFMEYCIRFRPNKPASPHLNGKVERSQKTDREEFYTTVDLDGDHLAEWQQYYNWWRPHSSLGGKTPEDCRNELSSITPFMDEVEANYLSKKERFQIQNYYGDLQVRKLKRCL